MYSESFNLDRKLLKVKKKSRKNKRVQILKYWDDCKSVSEENMRIESHLNIYITYRSIDINMAHVGKWLEYIIKSKDSGHKKQSFLTKMTVWESIDPNP